MRSFALVLVTAVAALASGCEPRETQYTLRLVTDSCASPSPVEGVTHLSFRVSGEDLRASEVSSLFSTRQQRLPDIPVGLKRVVEVRGYAGEPRAGGRLISVGRTLPFDVPDTPARTPIDLTVFLRQVSSITPISLSVSPASCARMQYPRAGHTATLLKDGKVLLAGGFQQLPGGERVAVSSAELFDPASGGFAEVPELSYLDAIQIRQPSPRAFHTGTLLRTGQVLLAGGEVYQGGQPVVLANALVFDPVQRAYGALNLNGERSRHGAAADDAGRVLLLGGTQTGGAQATSLEWYDADRGLTNVVPLASLGRLQMGVFPVQGGRFIAVAGGSTGTAVTDEVLLYGFSGGTFALTATARLAEARRAPAVTSVGSASKLVAVGGYSTLNERAISVLASSEVIATDPMVGITAGPTVTPRGDACAATLPDQRVIVVGGQSPDLVLGPRSDEAAELMIPSGTGPPAVLGMPNLPVGRFFHTCTALPDGTVLIAGGVSLVDAVSTVLQDAYVFTPAPLD